MRRPEWSREQAKPGAEGRRPRRREEHRQRPCGAGRPGEGEQQRDVWHRSAAESVRVWSEAVDMRGGQTTSGHGRGLGSVPL